VNGFGREQSERAKPIRRLWRMLKAGNTANIAGLYLCRFLCWIIFHMAVFFEVMNKQSVF